MPTSFLRSTVALTLTHTLFQPAALLRALIRLSGRLKSISGGTHAISSAQFEPERLPHIHRLIPLIKTLLALLLFNGVITPSVQAQTVKTCLSLSAPGCSCSVTALPIAYGAIAVNQLTAQRDAVGQVSVSCSASGQTTVGLLGSVLLNVNYSISLGSSSSRQLTQGASSIPYKLYQDSGRSVEWGTSAENKQLASTIGLSVTANLLGLITLNFPAANYNHPVYARLLPSGAALTTGSYSDTVTVTVTY